VHYLTKLRSSGAGSLAPLELYDMYRGSWFTLRAYPPTAQDERISELTNFELRRREMKYLCFAALTPFLGAFLFRDLVVTIIGRDTAPWFITVLFVLSSSLRPWSFIIPRLHHHVYDMRDLTHRLHCRVDDLRNSTCRPESRVVTEPRIQAILDDVDDLLLKLEVERPGLVVGHGN
jgi:hypothetical protein